jgi:UDP-N-acetylmuramate dehydrogenase
VLLNVRHEACLLPYNTLGLAAQAEALLEARSIEQLQEAVRQGWFAGQHPAYLLGGGSNIVMRSARLARVVRVGWLGRSIEVLDNEYALVRAAAGEPWHPFVMWTLAQGWHGLENLALIPGTVGAAPVQNIGAYGVEIKDVLDHVKVMDRITGEISTLHRDECALGYRDSVFKHSQGQRWVIVEVVMKLKSAGEPRFGYADLQTEFERSGISAPNALEVAQAVIGIRQRKLPDPAQLGNVGSFFKNPLLDQPAATVLLEQYPELPAWPVPQALGLGPRVKVSAAWMIDQCGWKGYRQGDAGVHTQHALVIVNHAKASGQQIADLAQAIQHDVEQRFGVYLEAEPVIW